MNNKILNIWDENKEIKDDRGNTYTIVALLGDGGFAQTWLVKDIFEKKFALKKIKNAESKTQVQKLIKEKQILEWRELNTIKHRHIVAVKDLVNVDNYWCILMEYVEGVNLEEYIYENGPLPENKALKYIRQLADAVGYLHREKKLLHRDIKPSNLMLNRETDEVKLIDFGSAKNIIDNNISTILYSNNFAPIEQKQGRKITQASDIYAIGATLYYLITGKFPIDIEDIIEVEDIELNEWSSLPPNKINPGITRETNEAILSAMRFNQADRPQSVEELVELLPEHKPTITIKCKEEYSFVTETLNSGTTYYFTFDENENLIKLGDGSYGVVYLGHDDRENMYAVKILYERQDQANESITQISAERFDAEIQSSRKIQQKARKNERSLNSLSSQIVGVINTVAGTKEFKTSQAFQTLKDKLQIQGLSNYVLVMEKYEDTLEGYLEKGIGQYAIQISAESNDYIALEQKIFKSKREAGSEIKEAARSHEDRLNLIERLYELTGYDVLRRMNFEQRIANILPYLQDIAQGLCTLHEAGYLHLDLKPGNIFIRGYGPEVQTVIGDLGFLDQNDTLDPRVMLGNYDILPLGTRHFQSPEQKEFFDIANVEIVDNSTSGIKLLIRDPKFRDSLIEKGDYVIFSMAREQSFTIESVDIPENQKNSPVVIKLQAQPRQQHIFNPGEKSQAIFFKVQGKRTDIFGFGAIAFNLLTCGESPVRFYESIHSSYDNRNSSIENLITLYTQISNYQSSEPGLIKIFRPFKDKNTPEYAPIEFVELILKCMLYKAEGTFYTSLDKGQQPAKSLLNNIIALHQGNNPRFAFKKVHNLIYNRQLVSEINAEEKDLDFGEQIQFLQNLPQEKFPFRLVRGFWYVNQIAKLIREYLSRIDFDSNNPDGGFCLAELQPKNLIIENSINNGLPDKLRTKFVVYQNMQSYLDDLREDLVFTKITIHNYKANPYVPFYFANLHRDISLKRVDKLYKYYFFDRYENQVHENDWIVVRSVDRTQNSLFRIVNVNPQERLLELEPVPFSANIDIRDDSLDRSIYYKNIVPCIYYFHMLGIYIYKIFFLGIGNNDLELIQKIHDKINCDIYFKQINNRNKSTASLEIDESNSSKDEDRSFIPSLFQKARKNKRNLKKIQDLLNFVTVIYLKLTFFDSEQSYYKSHDRDDRRINNVLDDINLLKDKIANLMEMSGSEIEQFILEENLDKDAAILDLSSRKQTEQFEKITNFYQLLSSKITFPPLDC